MPRQNSKPDGSEQNFVQPVHTNKVTQGWPRVPGHWKATGTTLVPVARLLAAQARAGKQPGGWSTGRISPPWILGINRAMFEPATSPAVVCWLCVIPFIS